jgi:hypothetical protein
MTSLQTRVASAAQEGRHLLIAAERGFDVMDVAQTVTRIVGPSALLMLTAGGDTPPIPATFPPTPHRGVVYLSLCRDGLRTAEKTLETARQRRKSGSGVVQMIFDASPDMAPGADTMPAFLRDAPDLDAIELPPLRNRREDFPHCLRYFIEKHARRAGRSVRSISLEAMDLLLSYCWPGNILEMDCVIAEVVRRDTGPEINFASMTQLDAKAFTDTALRASRFAGESLQEGLLRLDRLLYAIPMGRNAAL